MTRKLGLCRGIVCKIVPRLRVTNVPMRQRGLVPNTVVSLPFVKGLAGSRCALPKPQKYVKY